MANLLQDPYVWTGSALLTVLLIALWVKAPKTIADALDKRAEKIRDELDRARALREEAQELLAQEQRRQRDAAGEIEDIVTQAKQDAAAMAEETRKQLDAQLARRSKMAEDKIAQAEAQAVAEIRSRAADLAVAAAAQLIQGQITDAQKTGLIDQAIDDLRGKVN